jgi:hypothetical protein
MSSRWRNYDRLNPVVGTVIDSTVFGAVRLERKGWECRTAVPGMLDGVHVHICGSIYSAPPYELEEECFRYFLSRTPQLIEEVLTAVLYYYQAEIYEDGNRFTPSIRTVEVLRRHLSKPFIHVPTQRSGPSRITLCWECDFDPEHGIKVDLEDSRVVYAGGQGGSAW